jgi:hypothetical protein
MNTTYSFGVKALLTLVAMVPAAITLLHVYVEQGTLRRLTALDTVELIVGALMSLLLFVVTPGLLRTVRKAFEIGD